MTNIRQIALDTLKSGAPGLSEQTREVIAGIIARKANLITPEPVAETAGEAVAWRRRPIKETTGSGKEWVLYGPEDAAHYNAATDRYVIQALGIIGPVPAQDDDKLRIADADAKWLTRLLGDQKEGGHCGEGNVERRERSIWNDRIDRILAALKSTAAQEGGSK